MKQELTKADQHQESALYRAPTKSKHQNVYEFVCTTEETRLIASDSSVCGMEYTTKLSRACSHALTMLKKIEMLPCSEVQATVVHLLRGGLNFGLREALHSAF
ncbi:MAG: hypothetical protein KDD62_01985, partial [Bdellovibrionales bacterium]|nr:hypothetical protein [Bdellovibrionales bacterium]